MVSAPGRDFDLAVNSFEPLFLICSAASLKRIISVQQSHSKQIHDVVVSHELGLCAVEVYHLDISTSHCDRVDSFGKAIVVFEFEKFLLLISGSDQKQVPMGLIRQLAPVINLRLAAWI
jgi:hypothetical protein